MKNAVSLSPSIQFFRDQAKFSQKIADKSNDYCQHMLWYHNHTKDYGFPHLNSEQFEKMCSNIYSDIRATLSTLGEQEISNFFAFWEEQNLSENEMMENILKYCTEQTFDRAVFMIGATPKAYHLQITKHLQHPELGIQWNFTYCDRTEQPF